MISGTASAMHLRHRAVLRTPHGAGVDGYGHARRDGDDVTDQVLCYAWSDVDQAETFNEKTQGAIEVVKMMLHRDTVISTFTVVESITDRRGQPLFDGPLRVLGVSRSGSHIIATARRATGGKA